MKRIVLSLALLVGGTAVAHASPPGLTEPVPAGPAFGDGQGQALRAPGQRRARGGERRMGPTVRARLVQMFDRDGDGRLQGPERRAARRFVKQVVRRHARAQQGAGPRAERGERRMRGERGQRGMRGMRGQR